MVMEYLNGNTKRAVELQLKYIELIKALFCEVNPIPIKKALELSGFLVGKPRLPLTELEDEHVKLLKDAIESVLPNMLKNER